MPTPVNGQQRWQQFAQQQTALGRNPRDVAGFLAQGGVLGAGRQAPNVGQTMTLTPWTGTQPMAPTGTFMPGLRQRNSVPPSASPATPSLLSGPGGGGSITQGPVLNPNQVLDRQNQMRATPAPLPMTDASAGGALSQVLRDLVGQQGERNAIDFGLQASADNARQSFAGLQAGRRANLGYGQLQASDAISRLGDQGRVMSILLSLIGDLIPSGGLMNIPQAQFNMLGG